MKFLKTICAFLYSLLRAYIDFLLEWWPVYILIFTRPTWKMFIGVVLLSLMTSGIITKLQIFLSLPYNWIVGNSKGRAILSSLTYLIFSIIMLIGEWLYLRPALKNGWVLALCIIITLTYTYFAVGISRMLFKIDKP